MHHFYFVLISIFWGSNFILMNRASYALGPVEIAFWRLLGGGLILVAWWRITRHPGVARRYWPHLVFVGLFGNAVPFVLQPLLISRGFGHSYFGMMMAFVPLLTMLCSIPMLGVWPRWNELVGVLGGLGAMAALLWEGQSRGMTADTLALAFGIPLCYAVCNTYIRRNLSGVPPVPLTSSIVLVGATTLLPLVAVPGLLEPLGLGGPELPARWPIALASVAWMAVIGTGMSIVMFMSMLHARGPLFAGMVSYPIPLVALAWGAFDQEPISLRQVVVIVVVLAMVALVQFGGRGKRGEGKIRGEQQEPADTQHQPAHSH